MDRTARKGNAEALALRVVRALQYADEDTPVDHPAKAQVGEALQTAERYLRAVREVDDLPQRAPVDLLKRPGTIRHYGTGPR